MSPRTRSKEKFYIDKYNPFLLSMRAGNKLREVSLTPNEGTNCRNRPTPCSSNTISPKTPCTLFAKSPHKNKWKPPALNFTNGPPQRPHRNRMKEPNPPSKLFIDVEARIRFVRSFVSSSRHRRCKIRCLEETAELREVERKSNVIPIPKEPWTNISNNPKSKK